RADKLKQLKQIILKKDLCCFNCYLPTLICKNNKTTNEKCKFDKILLLFVIYFFEKADMFAQYYNLNDALFELAELSNSSNISSLKRFFVDFQFDLFDTESLLIVSFFFQIMQEWFDFIVANDLQFQN